MAEKREHHNALERKRRDHIKESYSILRESVPSLKSEKGASRALILKEAADYIQSMQKENAAYQQYINNLRKQNHLVKIQIPKLSRAANLRK